MTKSPTRASASKTATTRKRDGFANLRRQLGLPAGQALHELPARLQPRGMRLVIETERGVTVAALRQHARQVYGPDVTVSRLFPRFEPGVDIPSLQDFYIAFVPGLDADHLLVNPFDLAYAALKKGVVKGAEPDIHPASATQHFFCRDGHAEEHADRRWSLEAMNVQQAWDKLTNAGKDRGFGIRIAHIDTGIRFHRRVPEARFDLGAAFDFIQNSENGATDPMVPATAPGDVPGHGTMTSGVVIALDASPEQNNLCGVAPDATVVPFRVTRSVIVAPGIELAQAFDRAVDKNCDVVTVSLAGVAHSGTSAAVRNAYARGLLICCAAGQCSPIVFYPAVNPHAISCGGSDRREGGHLGNPDKEAKWSRAAQGKIEIAAPAELPWVCEPATSKADRDAGNIRDGTLNNAFSAIGTEEGTSFSAPAVAAIGALWLRFHDAKSLRDRYKHRRALNDVFREVLRNTARRPGHWHHGWGPGIVDAGTLVDAPLPPTGPILPGVDFLGQFDQPDDLDTWFLIFGDQPREAVIAMLQHLLDVANEADLRERLHQFNLELMTLVTQDAARFNAVQQAVQAAATEAAQRAADAAQSFVNQASNKLRSLLP